MQSKAATIDHLSRQNKISESKFLQSSSLSGKFISTLWITTDIWLDVTAHSGDSANNSDTNSNSNSDINSNSIPLYQQQNVSKPSKDIVPDNAT